MSGKPLVTCLTAQRQETREARETNESAATAYDQEKLLEIDVTLTGKYLFIALLNWHRFNDSENL